MDFVRSIAFSAVFSLLYVSPISAQVGAVLLGTVTDPSQAAASEVIVTVKNSDTGVVRETATDKSGRYQLVSLPIGTYEIHVNKNGFAETVRTGIPLTASQDVIVNLGLSRGEVGRQVMDNTNAPVISASPTGISGEAQVPNLPLAGFSYPAVSPVNNASPATVHSGAIAPTGETGLTNVTSLGSAAVSSALSPVVEERYRRRDSRITSMSATATAGTASIAWTTAQPASSRVDYGLTPSYGANVANPALSTSHNISLSGLSCNKVYDYMVSSTEANAKTSTSANATFQTSACGPGGGPVSDNFDAPALNTGLWTAFNPLSDGYVSMNGSSLVLGLPWGTAHDAGPAGNNTLRVMQSIPNTDFEVEVRFQSSVMFAQQREGIIVQQDAGDYIRFDVTNDGTTSRLTATGFASGTATTFLNTAIASSGPPIWLRVTRSGNNWTESYSLNGASFTSGGTFSLALSPSSIGPFSGSNGTPGITLPAMNAVVDYFFNTASAVSNSDGPLDFTRVIIDPNPPPTTLEKALADIDGDGRLDAVIGFGNPPNSSSGEGLFWYQYPHSGNPQDPWQKYAILTNQNMYEDMVPMDVNGDGAVDIIASFDGGSIYWFENPRGTGGDPRNGSWTRHFIGTGTGENNMLLADIDGDGKTDLVTNGFIFFQDSPTSWTPVALPRSSNGVALLDIGSGKGSIDVVGMGQSSPFPFVWLENPRETGANARTGTWQAHVIGPGFNTTGLAATYASADFNGDGRMDVVVADSEGFNAVVPSIPNPIYWWEAPADRRNGTWIQHTIAPAYGATHNLRAGDMDKNGTADVIAAEQEQALFRRVSVFYNDGHGNFTEQILSSGSGHSQVLGDTNGGGALDVLSAGHGYSGAPHPVELYVNPHK